MKKIGYLLLPAACMSFTYCLNAQVLETEEARPLLPGQAEIGAGLEFQTSEEGTETALPLAFEYGISKRLTALIEPVAFTTINPVLGGGTTGFGDLELTLFYNLATERKYLPSLSLGTEVKLPTTQNTLIGTGKTDFTPLLLASKKINKFDIHGNLSYTFLGKPDGTDLNNIMGYALGTIYKVNDKFILFGEVYGNTSALSEGETPEGQDLGSEGDTVNVISEISGGEFVGALGLGYYISPKLLLSFGINYDNNNAFLFRPGIEYKFGGRTGKNNL